ncbi:MAG: beta-ketoacyl synthase N-terminal-like domain-containing protein [Phycisphaerae bacterium]|nr:beta-ketoacyl synthase N-terminal-like domain-containing protein [Phycisphaerae bacterium]
MTDIAIIRMAAQSPLGSSLEGTVLGLRAGRVGIVPPEHLELQPRHAAGAGEVPARTGADESARAERLLGASINALLTADDRRELAAAPHRWGAVLGTTLAGMRHNGAALRADEAERAADADAAFARGTASAVLASALRGTGITGPTLSVSCACASALAAVAHACTLLETGALDAVIAGGYDSISEFPYGGFLALQLVASGPLSPFAKDREGMKLGEGVALFLLRRAGESGRTPIAHVVRTGEASDAHHLTQPDPMGTGAVLALRQVSGGGGLPDLIVAHATGTPANDAAEYAAYQAVFGDRLSSVPVVALKSRFGHPLGGAGALELAAAIACAEAGFVPSTAGRGRDKDSFPDLDLVDGGIRMTAPRDIVALAAGFGGANAAVRVVRGASATPPAALNAGAVLRAARVIGIGAVTPTGRGLEGFTQHCRARDPMPPFDEAILAPLLDRVRTRRLALLPRLMIAAVRDLAERVGMSAAELAATPLIAAHWCGAVDFTERYYRDLLRSGIDLANPLLFAESVPNIGSAQLSLALQSRRASLSVIGRRTAGIEALFLAASRISAGIWDRAIVVAADEAHPIVERVLARACGQPVGLASSAIAMLVAGPGSDGVVRPPALGIEAIDGRTSSMGPAWAARALLQGARPAPIIFTTSSRLDRALEPFVPAECRLPVPELGSASAFATLCMATTSGGFRVASIDGHGACWSVSARSG